MSNKTKDLNRLEEILDLAADSVLTASHEDLLAAFSDAEINRAEVDERVGRLVVDAVRNRRKERLAAAKEAYQAARRKVVELALQVRKKTHSPRERELEQMLLKSPNSSKSLTLAFRNKADSNAPEVLEDLVLLDSIAANHGPVPKLQLRSYSAEQLLDQLGITQPQEIDVEAIAYSCGAIVMYRVLRGCTARIVGTDNLAIVAVDAKSTRARQRFSVAHELGHWIFHRGTMAYLCNELDISSPWEFRQDPESRANQFAADLLMPASLFSKFAADCDITFEAVEELAKLFETSLTATAIRLVQFASSAAIVVCYGQEGRRWYTRGRSVPSTLHPRPDLGHETAAFELLFGNKRAPRPLPTKAKEWFSHRNAYRSVLLEDSIKIANDSVLTLLWWKDKSELAVLED